MNNTAYKTKVYLDKLEYFIKNLKIFSIKHQDSDEFLNDSEIANININETELQKKYDLIRFEKEPEWEFTLKNWS